MGYTVQEISEVWVALVHATGRQSFSKMVVPHLLFNLTWNVFDKLSRRENVFSLTDQANTLEEPSGPVPEKGEVANEVWRI